MDELQDKLGAILNDPNMMQQIMNLANSMGNSPQQQTPEPSPSMPEFDPGMLKKISSLASQSGIDREQQALLKALSPYLNRERIGRLERAMRAARTAKIASSFLGTSGISILSGR
jgi:hypothetical protein